MLLPGSRSKASKLNQLAGANRWVWNRILAETHAAYLAFKHDGKDKPCLSFHSVKDAHGNILRPGLAARFVALRKDTPWLQELPSNEVRYALKRQADAWQRFFKEPSAGRPRFKSYGHGDAFTIPQKVRIRTDSKGMTYLAIPKTGAYRLQRSGGHPYAEAKPKQVVVKRVLNRWRCFVTYDIGEVALPDNGLSVGVDRNCGQIATSDGRFYVMPDASRLHTKARRYQRRMARRKKGSNRRGIAKHRYAKAQKKLAMIRRNYLHHATRDLSNRFGTVCIEDLHVKAMTASAKGTVANPGVNVRAKATLNRSILDTGWSIFEWMLAYKTHRVVQVDAAYTSQTCSSCGHAAKANRVSQSRFHCAHCGFKSNADMNAALNIKALGTGASGRLRSVGVGLSDVALRKQGRGTRQRDMQTIDRFVPVNLGI